MKIPEDFPFGIVQLAGQGTAFDFAFLDSIWAETRESQEIVSREPGNGLAVTLDLSVDDYDIHPKNKQEIGRRLSFWALNRVYGKTSVEYQGPVFASEKIEGSKIRLSFNPTGGGFVSRGGPPSFFTIAGADQQFKWGTAVIEGNTIVVSSPEVPNPVAVRYAWSHAPCTANKPQIANVYGLAMTPQPRHAFAVTTIVQLDGSNRIVLPLDLRRAAGVPRGQRLKASATPGRIVLEVEPATQGKVVRRGKLKLWTGQVPSAPLAEAVEAARHYER